METVIRLGLPFKLDQLTEGLGNCFPVAIIQQLRRPEIFSQLNLTNKMLLKHKTQSPLLRLHVKRFITKSEHPSVARFKAYYEETEANMNGETWNAYWERMTENKVWVDSWFVQATAWYLKLDLWIVDCASREDHPFIRISGNLENPDIPCNGPIITLGTKSSCHYQSLLPIEMLHMLNHPLLNGSDKEVHNIDRATGKEQIDPSPTNIKNQGKPHDNSNEILNYVKETPPEMKTAFREPMNHVKENPPDMIHRKNTRLEETKAKNLRVSDKSHREDSLESKMQDSEDYQAFIYE